jgi:CRP-like cAMP-binding protein
MDQPYQSRRNRLLELLPAGDFDQLRPHLEQMPLDYKFELAGTGKPIVFVYFPVTGVASLVNTMMNGSAAEVGTVGNEGMVGLPIILGDTIAPNDAYVQVPGTALRMPAGLFRDALADSATMRTVMLHYVHALFNQIAQSAACNCFHTVEQRCCRWLLMTHDRVQSDRFILTQEFLGMMLGVRRTSITLTAKHLKKQRLMDYSRGHVHILDRHGLEQRSCECYAVSKREFDRLLGPPRGMTAALRK